MNGVDMKVKNPELGILVSYDGMTVLKYGDTNIMRVEPFSTKDRKADLAILMNILDHWNASILTPGTTPIER